MQDSKQSLTNLLPIKFKLNYLPLISEAIMAKTFDAQTQPFIVIEACTILVSAPVPLG